jgi:hypothetical protein
MVSERTDGAEGQDQKRNDGGLWTGQDRIAALAVLSKRRIRRLFALYIIISAQLMSGRANFTFAQSRNCSAFIAF